jgi:hypothetical protein
MTLSEDTKTTWPELDPDVLERIVPRAASQTLAPGLEEAFSIRGRGITVSDAGIPLRDWKAFLRALRANRQSIASKADGF